MNDFYINYIIQTVTEDEANIKSECLSKALPTSPKQRGRNGSTTEMAVDQLQASEKLIAGNC